MPDEYTGAVVDLLSRRKGEMLNMAPVETGGDSQTTSIEYLVPTRGMIGLRNSMLTATRGTAVMDTIFDSYRPYAGKSVYNVTGICQAAIVLAALSLVELNMLIPPDCCCLRLVVGQLGNTF